MPCPTLEALAHSIEVPAEGLQEELARLQFQKQALERELAAIVAHLGSVQRALGALESALVTPRAAAPVDEHTVSRASQTDTDTAADKQYGKLTEQVMAYFAEVGDADVRAREVAAALGRDADSGSINAVRSTLDRLVASSRIQRAGRGLYRTGRS
jgi:chromosome segregation ATPase